VATEGEGIRPVLMCALRDLLHLFYRERLMFIHAFSEAVFSHCHRKRKIAYPPSFIYLFIYTDAGDASLPTHSGGCTKGF
jgi:hypothetical protein